MQSMPQALAKDHFYITVGQAIRRVREEAGLKQIDLVKASGLSQTTVQNAESGDMVSLLALAKIAHALDCTLDDLCPVDALP